MKVQKKRQREVKGLDKSENHAKKGKSHVGDCELGRERRKRRAEHRWWKKKLEENGWAAAKTGERNNRRKPTQGLLPVMDNTKHWPKGKRSWSDWETVRAVGLCMRFWGRDLADFPEKWVAMGFKCGRAFMKRHFWSLSEDKNWKRTWNVPFCIRCQIADRHRTIKTAQGSPSAAYNGNRIFFFPRCQPSHSGETKRISST